MASEVGRSLTSNGKATEWTTLSRISEHQAILQLQITVGTRLGMVWRTCETLEELAGVWATTDVNVISVDIDSTGRTVYKTTKKEQAVLMVVVSREDSRHSLKKKKRASVSSQQELHARATALRFSGKGGKEGALPELEKNLNHPLQSHLGPNRGARWENGGSSTKKGVPKTHVELHRAHNQDVRGVKDEGVTTVRTRIGPSSCRANISVPAEEEGARKGGGAWGI